MDDAGDLFSWNAALSREDSPSDQLLSEQEQTLGDGSEYDLVSHS